MDIAKELSEEALIYSGCNATFRCTFSNQKGVEVEDVCEEMLITFKNFNS